VVLREEVKLDDISNLGYDIFRVEDEACTACYHGVSGSRGPGGNGSWRIGGGGWGAAGTAGIDSDENGANKGRRREGDHGEELG
jgi:hypothetical protein